MSPKEYPMQVWMKSYVDGLGIENSSKVSDVVWRCSESPCPSHTFDGYEAKILLPLAHALVHNWKGRDSITAFSVFARRFGIPSLEYICWLQFNGLDVGYADVLGDTLGKSLSAAKEVAERAGRSIWMACTAAYDVLSECLPRNRRLTSQERKFIHPTLHNAKFLSENVWGDNFQDITDTARNQIRDECKAIIKEFGSQMTKEVIVGAMRNAYGVGGWYIKQWAKGRPFMGWARKDGTFTAGINPTQEMIESVVFEIAEDAIEFAEEHDWNVLSTIKPK